MASGTEFREMFSDGWLPEVYKTRVRSDRTRAFSLPVPKRENEPVINFTLLGIELKVGRRRIACPDLATARYLQVFARIGCNAVALPYDISRIPEIADEFETMWQRTMLRVDKAFKNDPASRRKLIKAMRDEINEIGPGEAMPLFDRETRQRNET